MSVELRVFLWRLVAVAVMASGSTVHAGDSATNKRAAALAAFNEIAKNSPPHYYDGTVIHVFVEVVEGSLVIHEMSRKGSRETRVPLKALAPTVDIAFHDPSDPATFLLKCASFPRVCADGTNDRGHEQLSTIYVDFNDRSCPPEKIVSLWLDVLGATVSPR